MLCKICNNTVHQTIGGRSVVVDERLVSYHDECIETSGNEVERSYLKFSQSEFYNDLNNLIAERWLCRHGDKLDDELCN